MLGSDNLLEYLIVDTGPLIKNIQFDKLASHVITTSGVQTEIRDHATRSRIQLLPFEIQTQSPSEDSLRFVADFAKRTGDIRSLSAVDLSVIALTYDLEKRINGVDHLRSEPLNEIKVNKGFGDDNVTNLAGFYVPKKKTTADFGPASRITSMSCDTEDKVAEVSNSLDRCDLEEEGWTTVGAASNSSRCNRPQLPEELEEEENDDEYEEEDDEGDWIGPSNIESKKMESLKQVQVACTTTDFAVQNVLLQIGLHVVSVDGVLIRYAKKYVLKCYACFTVTDDCTRRFCGQCGHRTLEKVAVTTDEDGVKWYQRLSKKDRSKRGKRFSLPNPTGGRHGNNARATADQIKPNNNFSFRDKVDVLSSDFVATSGPFAATKVESKAFNFRQVGNGSHRNPNERRKNTGNRKSKKK